MPRSPRTPGFFCRAAPHSLAPAFSREHVLFWDPGPLLWCLTWTLEAPTRYADCSGQSRLGNSGVWQISQRSRTVCLAPELRASSKASKQGAFIPGGYHPRAQDKHLRIAPLGWCCLRGAHKGPCPNHLFPAHSANRPRKICTLHAPGKCPNSKRQRNHSAQALFKSRAMKLYSWRVVARLSASQPANSTLPRNMHSQKVM